MTGILNRISTFWHLGRKEKLGKAKEYIINHLLYILLFAAIVGISIYDPRFLSLSSVVNIISLSAANLPIALGIAGCIILMGTDLSAGRIVGVSACVAASLLQASSYPGKMFPSLPSLPIFAVFAAVIGIGAIIGFINGFCTAKFKLHPFIVTLATQLITYGVLLIYLMQGTNNGQSISGLDPRFTDFITGSFLKIGNTSLPNYLIYVAIITVIMWFHWRMAF